MPVSSRFWRNVPSIRPTVGKFCTPEKPAASTSRRNSFITRNGSVPHTPASTGVCVDDRNHLAGHVHHDGVGVAVGHHARERAAARHAKAAGVVDHQQVDAAGFRHLGADAGARAAADDRLAGGDLRTAAGREFPDESGETCLDRNRLREPSNREAPMYLARSQVDTA